MSRSELKAWLSLAALAAVFWWFQMRMLDGLTIVDQSPGRLLWVYFVVIGAATGLELIISAVLGAGGGRAIEQDERDLAISSRANQIERVVVIAAVNVLIWQALWEGAMPGRAVYSIDPTHLPTLFFLLFAVLFLGESANRISTIILYRLQAARG